MHLRTTALLLLLTLTGCYCDRPQPLSAPTRAADHTITVFVPGVDGDGFFYNGLRRNLHASDLRVCTWGIPFPFCLPNYEDKGIHDQAETKLAHLLDKLEQSRTEPGIVLVGHSAGCGVILGALGRVDPGVHVREVILLAPSVSPGYPLAAPLAHVDGQVHYFYSRYDIISLRLRCGIFGCYDRVRTAAAGHAGFDHLDQLPPDLRAKLVGHPYEHAWKKLGNDAGHLGSTAAPFVDQVVRPLLATN